MPKGKTGSGGAGGPLTQKQIAKNAAAAVGILGPGAAAGLSQFNGSACLIKFPSISLGVANVGGGCIFSKTAARALIGGGVIVVLALPLTFVGIALLAAAGFQRSGLASKAADVAAVVPGGQAAAVGLRAASRGGATGIGTGIARGTQHATRERQRKEAATRREQDARRRRAERGTREAQRKAPARGKHAKPSERGPYEGRHRSPE